MILMHVQTGLQLQGRLPAMQQQGEATIMGLGVVLGYQHPCYEVNHRCHKHAIAYQSTQKNIAIISRPSKDLRETGDWRMPG